MGVAHDELVIPDYRYDDCETLHFCDVRLDGNALRRRLQQQQLSLILTTRWAFLMIPERVHFTSGVARSPTTYNGA